MCTFVTHCAVLLRRLSYDDCLEQSEARYVTVACCIQYCVPQLYTVINERFIDVNYSLPVLVFCMFFLSMARLF